MARQTNSTTFRVGSWAKMASHRRKSSKNSNSRPNSKRSQRLATKTRSIYQCKRDGPFPLLSSLLTFQKAEARSQNSPSAYIMVDPQGVSADDVSFDKPPPPDSNCSNAHIKKEALMVRFSFNHLLLWYLLHIIVRSCQIHSGFRSSVKRLGRDSGVEFIPRFRIGHQSVEKQKGIMFNESRIQDLYHKPISGTKQTTSVKGWERKKG